MVRNIAIFDFDGTLILKDSFAEFIKFSKSPIAYYLSLFILSPVLIFYFLKLISNAKAKETIFSFHFKNMPFLKFEKICQSFCSEINKILNEEVFQRFREHKIKSDEILIISASIENWILPWATQNGVNAVLGTQIEVKKNKLTGRFSSPNCSGYEKVNRLKSYLGEFDRKDVHVSVYGNSKGDTALMNWADIKYWCKKKYNHSNTLSWFSKDKIFFNSKN